MASFWDLLRTTAAGQPFVPDADQVDPWLRFLPAASQADAGTNAALPIAAAANRLGGVLGAAAQPSAGVLNLPLATPRGQPFLPLGVTPDQVDPWLRPVFPPVTPQADTGSNAAPPIAASANQLGGVLGAAVAMQPSASLWDPPQATPYGQPLWPAAPTPSQLGPRRTAAPLAASVPSVASGPLPAPAGGLRANLLAMGAAAIRPLTDFFPTQGQYARDGVDLMKQGWRDITAWPVQATTPETLNGIGAVPQTPETARGVGEMGLGALEYLGSYPNAFIHSFIGEPAEEDFGIPSKYTDFTAGFLLPFAKRLPGMRVPPRMPRVAPSLIADAAEPAQGGPRAAEAPAARSQVTPTSVPAGASNTSDLRPLTLEEDNRSLLHDKARSVLQQIDPGNVKLQSPNLGNWTPAIEDI